jgi:hypothetical protein
MCVQYEVENYLFLDMKGNSFPQLTDRDWMHDFAFCIDIAQYLNELHNSLQGTNQLISKMFAKIKVFKSKLQLWELQLRSNNLAPLPTLRTKKPSDIRNMLKKFRFYNKNLTLNFKNFKNMRPLLVLFSTPFDVNVETVPDNSQLEITDLQCSEDLKSNC